MEIESPSSTDCLAQYSEIAKTLNTTGYVVLRNANWSIDEANDFFVQFCELHKWKIFPGERRLPHWVYVEDHKATLSMLDAPRAKDEIFVHWHAEQTNLEFPQHGALWQMLEKSAPFDSGQTGFIDNAELYDYLIPEDAAFLERCKVVMTPTIANYDPEELTKKIIVNERNDSLIIFDMDGYRSVNFIRPIVQVHERTGKKCIRFNSHYEKWELNGLPKEGVMSALVSVDDRIPTINESQRAHSLMSSIARRIYNEHLIQTWIKWGAGDIIITDLFRMTHAVRGGFWLNERKFRGIWAFANDAPVPLDPKQRDEYSSIAIDDCIRAIEY